MPVNYAKRRRSFRKLCKAAGADSALVTNETNVRYLTGFTGDSSFLWFDDKQEWLLTDSRYTVQLSQECPDLELISRDSKINIWQLAARTLGKAGTKKLALETHHLTKQNYDQLVDALPQVTPVPTSGLVEQLRAIKDKSELATIKKAIAIAERSFAVIRSQLTEQQTEIQIAHNLEHQIRAFGGSRCAFDPIVGVGKNGALPHGRPSADSRIGDAPFVLIDWGAQYDGYASDLTRILVTARISPKLRKVYNLVLQAQLAAIGQIRDGAKLADVDRAARKTIEDGGFGKRFGHGLGHGFGLQIHESPFLTPTATGVLKTGMVITIEPGIYLPTWGGVRIEDDVLVTEDGFEVLTSAPKEIDQCVVSMC
ncbi:MAG: Xaa-Pro peptidase family protein [Pirellulaceae bacterium]|nr:Xaa-Pro peptidase family protein [Pirellulaceae bacterium]